MVLVAQGVWGLLTELPGYTNNKILYGSRIFEEEPQTALAF